MSESLSYEEEDLPCKLCGGTGQVEVIPHGGGANDSQEDECPWCLNRKYQAWVSSQGVLK